VIGHIKRWRKSNLLLTIMSIGLAERRHCDREHLLAGTHNQVDVVRVGWAHGAAVRRVN
jgi:hypothetical protein